MLGNLFDLLAEVCGAKSLRFQNGNGKFCTAVKTALGELQSWTERGSHLARFESPWAFARVVPPGRHLHPNSEYNCFPSWPRQLPMEATLAICKIDAENHTANTMESAVQYKPQSRCQH